MNRNSFGLWVPPKKPSTWTKIPSEPSSAAPTATLSAFRTRRGSVVTRSSPVVCTITQSIRGRRGRRQPLGRRRSEEHTSELQSPCNLVCRLLLEKKKKRENARLTPLHQQDVDTR